MDIQDGRKVYMTSNEGGTRCMGFRYCTRYITAVKGRRLAVWYVVDVERSETDEIPCVSWHFPSIKGSSLNSIKSSHLFLSILQAAQMIYLPIHVPG